ncbi:MAG TPA: polysaccharide deacetylase family protein [Vicinamibacterales bacterium]|nr:polysaccharide deacetylase family protein [Vicinamibacterales bacterium]
MGFWRRLHRLTSRGQVMILTYHAVVRQPLGVPDACFLAEHSFIEQLEYLSRRFEFVRLQDVTACLRRGTIERPMAVLTFDDGYRNNFEVAYPVLRRLDAPATIFLATRFIDSTDMIWSWRLHRAVTHTSRREITWRSERFPLTTIHERQGAARALKRQLKALAHPELERETAALVEQLGDDPARPADPDSPFAMLDTAAIRQMAASGLVDFGAHTCSHAILSRLSPDECRHEVVESIRRVKEVTGRPCVLFAYPNGQKRDYTSAAVSLLESAGIQTAVTTMRHANTPATPALELGRFSVRAGMTGGDVMSMIDGAYVDASMA